jgi:Cysteine rich repeat
VELHAKTAAALKGWPNVAVLAMERQGGRMLVRFLSAGFIASCLLVAPAKVQAQGLEDLRTYCVSDIKRLCKGVKPGGGRLLQCLKANKKGMTVGCAQALQKLKARKQ